MRLTVLGSGTAVPSLKRLASSYLVTAGTVRVLVDIGPSVVRRLLEFGYQVNDVDVILLTHFHVDHTADLSTFLFASNYGSEQRQRPLLIVGGPGIHRFYRGLQAVYPWIRPVAFQLTVKSLPGGRLPVGGFTVEAHRVRHNPESIALKISMEKSLVFSGDTDYCKGMVSLAKGADLLVAECAFPESKVQGHMNLDVLQRLVDESEPRRVLISHLYPEWDDYAGVLHTPVLLAEDGLEIEL
jgi:ribonuclease BN (tRNA processing enzyme)